MFPLTLAAAAHAMQARIVLPEAGSAGSESLLGPPSIDSRKIGPGDCFFAIRAERDGHDFVSDACRRGAGAVVISKPVESPAVPALMVRDTTQALQDLAAHVRRLWGGRVFALTGSMGKTTTRQFLAALAESRFRVLQTAGNLNNHLGLPVSLLSLEPSHELAILELGMNHAGEIARLAEICRPDAGMVTNVAPVHIEFFESLDAIADAKEELVRGLPSNGWLVGNGDDPRVAAMADRFAGRSVSFGFDVGADYRVDDWKYRNLQGTAFTLQGPDFRIEVELPCLGRAFVANAAAAIAAAVELGVDPKRIPGILAGLTPTQRRGRLHQWRDTLVFDDSYNSNPEAVREFLAAIAQFRGGHRWVLALGDMLELGTASPQFHREIGSQVARYGPDLLVTVGPLSELLAESALASGFPQRRLALCPDSAAAADRVAELVRPGDLVTVKGSRGIQMERIVDKLREVLS